MSMNVNPYYDQLCATQNKFQVVMQIAQQSRQICTDMPHSIEMSQAIRHLANGDTPNPEYYRDRRMDKVEDYLCGVEDIEIANAVRLSYAKSLEVNNLVYVYDKVRDPNRRTKIRIIMRMLWQDGPYAH